MHNHRQGNNGIWAGNLNQIRIGHLPDEVVDKLISLTTDEELLDHNTIHGFYPNSKVNAHNDKMLSITEGEEVSFQAIHIPMKGIRGKYSTENGMIEGTGFFDILKLKVGARVALITNLDQIDDLMNGQWGTIVGLETKPHKCAIVKFDDPNVGKMQRQAHSDLANKYDGGTPIFYYELEFSLKTNPNLKGKIQQIPLRLSWASTFHKVQVNNS